MCLGIWPMLLQCSKWINECGRVIKAMNLCIMLGANVLNYCAGSLLARFTDSMIAFNNLNISSSLP